MANYMNEVAKMLGVEIGEEFYCNDGYCFTYKITDRGLSLNGVLSAETLMMLLNGLLTIKRKPWKPNANDIFWSINADGNAVWSVWIGATQQLLCYKLGNCYRAEEEAVANRDKWISFYASDEVLEGN